MVRHTVSSLCSVTSTKQLTTAGFFGMSGDINSIIKYFPEIDASCTISIPGNSYFFQDQAHSTFAGTQGLAGEGHASFLCHQDTD